MATGKGAYTRIKNLVPVLRIKLRESSHAESVPSFGMRRSSTCVKVNYTLARAMFGTNHLPNPTGRCQGGGNTFTLPGQ